MNDVALRVIRSAVQVVRRKGEIIDENNRKECGGTIKNHYAASKRSGDSLACAKGY